MCNMLYFWLTLSLLTLILHKLESLLFLSGTFLFDNKIMSGILAFRLYKGNNLPVSLNRCLFNTLISQRFKTNLYNTTNLQFNFNMNPKIPKHFEEKISKRLDTNTSNPLGIVAHLIRDFFNSYEDLVVSKRKFDYYPVQFEPVTISQNFDELQVPLDHVSRDPKDSYYLDKEYIKNFKDFKNKSYLDIIKEKNGVYDRDLIHYMADTFKHSKYKLLPTHTTSHITNLLRDGITEAIYSGQVFRRDEIDSQHYPVFHQMDGYLLFTREDIEKLRSLEEFKTDTTNEVIFRHLKRTLENLVSHLFKFVTVVSKNTTESRKINFSELEKYWDDEATFPFTFPSSEYYLKNDAQPTELLGCGVLKNIILENNFKDFGEEFLGGWAFGIGLERLTMVLCKISDIRQFWETDERFLKQYEHSFSEKKLPVFVKYSKNPPVVRDLSFYIPDSFDEEIFRSIIMEKGKGYVEDIQFVSIYFNEKISKKSLCYRVVYRAFEENLTNSFVNSIHEEAVKSLKDKLRLTIR
ncbi:phenylalanine-trna synthetase, putative [Theileria annulata]|uniref:phenylalanine--tRNA ligase n=1 Tax=Theileria annulata TaxID=5874 RepID=Q4UDM1_THEAN|nr:phenylalanine-trna synthetase, putative [Theileria annulata]CAI74818.1 phenylalanine-trna synthetase, putative [Theileria annulata]|eukprot:XP_952550.1 phenylalanine-trna synthetase, putative [Theileria annulata]